MKAPLIAVTLLALACASCKAPSPPARTEASSVNPLPKKAEAIRRDDSDLLEPVIFAGVPLPGTAAQAKSLGFTSCEPYMDSGLRCSSSQRVGAFGVVAERAEVTLNAEDNLKRSWKWSADSASLDGKKLEELSYRELRLHFADADYKDDCAEDFRKLEQRRSLISIPDECAKADNIASFRHALVSNGWIETSSRRRTTHYYHPGVALALTATVEFGSEENIVEVEPTSLEEVSSAIQQHEAIRRAVEEKVEGTQSLIDGMKSRQ